jgi:hypothetical protein
MAKKQGKPKRKAKRKAAARVGVGLAAKKPTPKSRYSRYITNILNKTTPSAFDLYAGGSMAEFLMEPDAQMLRVLPVGIYLDTDNDSDVSRAFEIWGKAFEHEGFEIVAGSIIRGSAFITLFARYEPIHSYNIHKKVSDVIAFASKKLPDKLKKTAIVVVGASIIVSFSLAGKPIKQPVHQNARQTWEAILEKVKEASEAGERQGNRIVDILEMLAILKAKSALKKKAT